MGGPSRRKRMPRSGLGGWNSDNDDEVRRLLDTRTDLLSLRPASTSLHEPGVHGTTTPELPVGIGFDHARIDSEAFIVHQSFIDAAVQRFLEHKTQRVTVSEPTESIL